MTTPTAVSHRIGYPHLGSARLRVRLRQITANPCDQLVRGYGRVVLSNGTSDAVWEELRATRWDPPGAACDHEHRRRTYVFALEQAEQMFRAAANVGLPTRPLLALYGLNQAGRSIAAAASKTKGCSNDVWQLKGHGIHCADKSLYGPLPDIAIYSDGDERKSSFVKLSQLLDSPLPSKSFQVTLNGFWDCLPENRLVPLCEQGESRRTPLYAEYRDLFSEPHPLVHVPVVGFPSWVMNATDTQKILANYMASFPGLRGVQSVVQFQGIPAFTSHDDGWGEINMNWELPKGLSGSYAERLAYLQTMTRPYDGALCFFPELGNSGRSAHPLMTWWAVLFTLSILARYQPAEWAQHIDVDHSRYAVPLENLLKRAIDVVPRLIAEAIIQVARPNDE